MPEGFEISLFYTGDLAGPRFMGFDRKGRLCVSNHDNSNVMAFEDTDHDGAADLRTIIAQNTLGAQSIAFFRGDLYAASEGKVLRYSGWDNASGVYTTSSVFIDTLPYRAQGTENHTSRTILFDEKRGKIFVSVGSGCNACRENDSLRSTILSYDLEGSNRQIFAKGLRNAVGLTLDSSGNLWACVAERNNLGDDAPPEPVTIVKPGAFYGWPFAYGEKVWDRFVDSEYRQMLPITMKDSELVASMTAPDATLSAHSTPL